MSNFTSITQRNGNDCMLACIAMALHTTYDAVWSEERARKVVADGGVSDYDEWLQAAGLRTGRDYHWLYTAGERQQVIKAMLWGRRAILSVDSLNNKDGYHAVYWDGAQLWDPSPKSVFSYLSTVCISRAILLRAAV